METKQSTKSKRIQLVIPDWLYEEILKKSEKMGVNVSESIREAIREFVKK